MIPSVDNQYTYTFYINGAIQDDFPINMDKIQVYVFPTGVSLLHLFEPFLSVV